MPVGNLTVDEGRTIALNQLDHYERMLTTQEQRVTFRASYASLVLRSPEPKTGYDVPRGVDIERLYFLASGRTEQDHNEYLSSLD